MQSLSAEAPCKSSRTLPGLGVLVEEEELLCSRSWGTAAPCCHHAHPFLSSHWGSLTLDF